MRNKKGFTLVELLVTIGIIGILATVTVVSVGNARAKARDSKRLSDIKQIQSAFELYSSDVGGYYPAGSAVILGSDALDVICDIGLRADTTGCTSTYLNPVPKDPTSKAGSLEYKYTAAQADGTTACTDAAKDCATYKIEFQLEAKSGDLLPAVTHKGTPGGIQP